MLSEQPRLIEAGIAVDDRGQLTFANDFQFEDVKRFYMVENFSNDVIRAFHGHLKEAKYALVVAGSAIIAVVAMDDTEKPNQQNQVFRYVLSSRKPSVLYIPAGYANGFKALENGTKVMFFSTATLAESERDDYRFPHDYWGKEIWEAEQR